MLHRGVPLFLRYNLGDVNVHMQIQCGVDYIFSFRVQHELVLGVPIRFLKAAYFFATVGNSYLSKKSAGAWSLWGCF